MYYPTLREPMLAEPMANPHSFLGSPMPSTPKDLPPRLLSPFNPKAGCLLSEMDQQLPFPTSRYPPEYSPTIPDKGNNKIHVNCLDCISLDCICNNPDEEDADCNLKLALSATPPIEVRENPPSHHQYKKQLKTPHTQILNTDFNATFTGVHTPLGTPLTPRIMSSPMLEDVAIVKHQRQGWTYEYSYNSPSESPLSSSSSYEESPTHTLLRMITDDSPKAPAGKATRELFARYLPRDEILVDAAGLSWWYSTLRMVDYIDVSILDQNLGPLICFLSESLLLIYNEISGKSMTFSLDNASLLDDNMFISIQPQGQNPILLSFETEYKFSRWRLALYNPHMIIPDELMTCITSFERFM